MAAIGPFNSPERSIEVMELRDEIERLHSAVALHSEAAERFGAEIERLRAALTDIQALSLKTENANLVWQRATRALEQSSRQEETR